MAEATTTRPRARSRAATGTTAKTEPAKAPAKPKTDDKTATEVTRFSVELEHAGTTKSYEKFIVPDSYKGTVVGSVYAPIGTARVGVVVIGGEDTDESGAE